jgi:hypothetical protein
MSFSSNSQAATYVFDYRCFKVINLAFHTLNVKDLGHRKTMRWTPIQALLFFSFCTFVSGLCLDSNADASGQLAAQSSSNSAEESRPTDSSSNKSAGSKSPGIVPGASSPSANSERETSQKIELPAKKVELASLLPETVGLTIEVRGLTDKTQQVLKSNFAIRLQNHSAWQQVLRSTEIRKFKELNQGVATVTGRPLVEWLQMWLGREVILSLAPRQGRQQPGFVLLARLENPDDADALLTAWNKLDPREQTQIEHQGHQYFSRCKPEDPAGALYFCKIDNIAVLSDNPTGVTSVLDMYHLPATGARLINLPRYQQILQLLHSKSAVRVFVQPEVWKSATSDGDRNGDREENLSGDLGQQTLQRVWGASASIGVGIRLEGGLIAETIIQSDRLANSKEWNRVVERIQGNPTFLARVPRDALFAFGGRHDFAAVSQWALNQLPPEQLKRFKSIRQMARGIFLGRDVFDDILPLLPADFGGFVVPRRDLDVKAIPFEGLISVSLPAKSDLDQDGKIPVGSAINNGAQTGFSMLTALYNANANADSELRESQENGIVVHWIETLGPYRPAYAVRDDELLISSSPQLIRDFLRQATSETWAADPELRKFRESCFSDSSQVIAVHGRMARQFVDGQRVFLVRQLMASHNLSSDEAQNRLDRLMEWIQLSDAVVLASTLRKDHVKVVLGIAVESHSQK